MNISWQTNSATSAVAPTASSSGRSWGLRSRARALARGVRRPELAALLALAAVLNLWALSRNGWANDYYSAAVRSMSSSWHDFLFVSLDRGGVMSVDKPPLALWVQALSVRAFGFHWLSILVPQALMGVASVALLYDLVARRFGRLGGFVAGLALAVTPITVAISRHNNPDALLVLCSVAALWCALRAIDPSRPRRRTLWLVLAGVCVGLGFETKMGVALVVVPGIAVAWLYLDPGARGRLRALGQLLTAGAAMVLVGGAWPALVELVPAADRPWVSGTSDNSVLSLIFEYNGLGRVDGQAGGPGGMGGSMFGGTPGPLRLLNSALGGQVGWLLGFAAASGLYLLVSGRLRRSDPRSGWLIVVGGAFVTAATLFSFASGIFHPYYVALLAPFLAALVGAGAAELIGGGRTARLLAPVAVIAGVGAELAVLGDYPSQLSWLTPVLIAVGVGAVLVLLAAATRPLRLAAIGGLLAALLVAPTVWAFDTLGYATSGTFPAGGPASLADGGFGGGPFGGVRGPGARPGALAAVRAGGAGESAGPEGGVLLFGNEGSSPAAGGEPQVVASGAPRGGSASGAPPTGSLPGLPVGGAASGAGAAGGGFGAGGGGPFGGDGSLNKYIAYVERHGGGTIAVSSQSSAASAILEKNDVEVAGIGGFSGRESDVSASWLAQEVRSGRIRWVLDEEGSGGGPSGSAGSAFAGRPPGDTRTGSRRAMAAVARACTKVTVAGSSGSGRLYDCQGRAGSLAAAGESR